MGGRTAGNDHDLMNLTDLLVCHPQFLNLNPVPLNPWRKSIHDSLWLFVHLLQHEMFIPALLGSIHIPLNPYRLLHNLFFIHVEKLHGLFRHTDNLFILDKIDIPGITKHRRNIRSNNASAFCMAHNQRAVLAHCIKFIRMIPEHNSQSIRPFHPVHDFRNCLQRVPLVIIVQKMGNHFRICLRHEFISPFHKFLLKLQIVLNNTIMNHYDTFICIKMRMGIHIRRRAVSRPACMADSHGSRKHCPVMGQFTQYLQPPL